MASFLGEGRELLRLGLCQARDLMQPGAPAGVLRGPQIPASWAGDQALSAVLGAGGGPLAVIGEDGQVVGTLALGDFVGELPARSPSRGLLQ
ncbi:hypothetical protein ACFP81_08540 [Deinococcus lacus]|uniref:CBS domain-containing protein n=1 Tax=Deinococcus lacus TaxID=392561 RepID=A0ABW1YGQ7_9DEIO